MGFNYFSNYPTTSYSKPTTQVLPSGIISSVGVKQVDLYIKYKIRDAILNNASLFYPYVWKDTDTPWTLAKSYYGSEQFHWVIFYANNAFDLVYDFPMTEDALNRYLIKKYEIEIINFYFGGNSLSFTLASLEEKLRGARAYCNNTIHHLEIEGQYTVDTDTFNSFLGERRIVTVYDFEIETNEAKRNIQVLDNEYLQFIIKDFISSFSQVRSQRIVEGQN